MGCASYCINKCDIVEEDVLELVEIEMRELLDGYGFDSEQTPFIYGSALLALKGDTESEYGEKCIHRLMQALDSYVEAPERDFTLPFYLPISSTVTVPYRGLVMVGTLKRGVMKKGQDAELVGYDHRVKTRITGMQVFRQNVDSCQAGENVGVMARGIKKDMVEKGMALVAPKSLSLRNRFEATIYMLASSEGGRKKALPARYIQMFYIDTWCMSCRFDLPPDIDLIMPGEQGVILGTLLCQMPISVGMSFTIREEKSTIATGVITKLLPSVTVPKRKLVLVDFKQVVPNR
ncbi:Translation elongation factor EFTu-like domain 2 [Trinorchestia longiramus]|nr:Translation elongation factor EFTu-like domain 2 [Trinorchestia longiramus]